MTDIREAFPALGDLAYLDNAATTQKPLEVLDALRRFYLVANANPHRGTYALTIKATGWYERARETVAEFLNASPREIIFTHGATDGLNLVAGAYARHALVPGDEVLVTVQEHHSNLLPWRSVCEETDADLVELKCNAEGWFSPDAIQNAITSKTKIVAIAHTGNVLGQRLPVEDFVKAAHAVGAVIVLDAAQAVAHEPLDVKALNVDFLAFSGHKMYAPTGTGALYVREPLLEQMQPVQLGGSMADRITTSGFIPAPPPHCFEAGTVDAAGAHALGAAIKFMRRIGWDNIQTRERVMTSRMIDGLKSIKGVELLGSQRPRDHNGIATFAVKDIPAHVVATALDAEKICVRDGAFCAQPLMRHLGVPAAVRASVAMYTGTDDIDRLLEAVEMLPHRL